MSRLSLPLLISALAAVSLGCQSSLAQTPSAAAPAPSRARAAPAQAPAAKPAFRPMVAAANPVAADAGLKVLREGGTAVDAAVAMQAVLGLVEPQSSGLGGGSFMVFYDAKTKQVTAYDGRETAPAAAGPDWFLKADGAPMSFPEAVRSGRSTGVPGAIAMLSLAHKDHGKKPWNSLFGDAERLADQGFVVNARLATMARRGNPAPDVAAYLTKADGQLVAEGDVLKNPAYAATVRGIAAQGPKGLLEGDIAKAIVARVGQAPNPSPLTMADLAGYKPQKGPALCRPYRVYVVCAPPAPAGGPGLLEALGIFAATDIAKHGPTDPQGWYLFSEGSRLMYADRDAYVADPSFVSVPTDGLLSPTYVASRAKLIGADKAGPAPGPGAPPGAQARGPDSTREPGGTSHFVIMDANGDVVSMTTTVESVFGSGRMVGGFILNNQLTDFSLVPRDRSGALVANAVAGGKRPRSSMAPVIVLDQKGGFIMAVGSPGGNSILAYNLKAIVAYLDWKLPLQDALALPNLVARGAGTSGEPAKFAPGVIEGLAAKGVIVRPGGGEESGLHALGARDGKLEGAADPRRPGVARGL